MLLSFDYPVCILRALLLRHRTTGPTKSAQPSSDLEYFSRDPSAIRRRQKSGDRRNILRLPEATERCLCNHLLLKVAPRKSQGVKTLGLHSTWIDRVHADLFRPKLLGQYSGNGTHRTLGRRIDYTCRRVKWGKG